MNVWATVGSISTPRRPFPLQLLQHRRRSCRKPPSDRWPCPRCLCTLDHFVQRFQTLGKLVWSQDVQVPSSQPRPDGHFARGGQWPMTVDLHGQQRPSEPAQAHFFHFGWFESVGMRTWLTHSTGRCRFSRPPTHRQQPDSGSSNTNRPQRGRL